MGRAKVARKSTSVDMTAMCDVAFLLLSFFILTTKFKPDEALTVTTPKSVATKAAEQKDVVLITMDKMGKVYFSVSDDAQDEKRSIIDYVDREKQLSLTDAEKNNFVRAGSFVGVPFGQLKSYLQQPAAKVAQVNQPGIPVTDTLNNELQVWMRAANTAFQGARMNILVRGDNEAKYPSFKGVTSALKKNELFKFQVITDPEGVPPGTELYKKTQGGTVEKPAA
ncbi:MAG: biopolymer transporter ExbD [Chitinophagaceae bacterium]|nr:biopolymer transporter ExbD [Chitinophagaceae bacterium]